MLIEGVGEGIELLLSGDPGTWGSIKVSVSVSATSAFFAAILSLCLAIPLSRGTGLISKGITSLLGAAMATPTVLIGLLGYAALARSGPMGDAGLLYTPWAMILGQMVLAVPLMTGIANTALKQVDKRIELTVLSLGGGRMRALFVVLGACHVQLTAALIAGFGRVFSEVGVSMMLGGNIRGQTRNITTGIAYETGRGEFGRGVALGLVLLVVALVLSLLVSLPSLRTKRS
jgi:tungstate transport system permease protein